ncbi:MAG TPA: VWA domain-containing protein [Dermatophilaceae bacterium]|nr:VWA domain-containing protein [Dermatophilaceae bacterium]
MTFTWPWALLTLLLLPLLVASYRRLRRRRAGRRAALASLGLVGTATTVPRLRRSLPAALFLGAVTLLSLGSARPEATVPEPRREGTVVLAFDVSNSMAATDLQPTRMAAAKAAGRAFVQRQPASIRLAVVAFGESGVISSRPTTDRAAVLAAVDRLAPQGGTALGRGIQTSLSAIAGRTVELDEPKESPTATADDIGYYGSAAVILLSDGENTAGPDPVAAAELASTAGVKIYPVGLGSPSGTVVDIDGFKVATALDEPLLRQIAATTDGRYFAAADERALNQVYQSIELSWTVESKRIEVTALFALTAAVLVLLAAGLSFAWSGRVI